MNLQSPISNLHTLKPTTYATTYTAFYLKIWGRNGRFVLYSTCGTLQQLPHRTELELINSW